NVGKPSAGARTSLSTRRSTLARSPISVRSVSKLLGRLSPFLSMPKQARTADLEYIIVDSNLIVRNSSCGILGSPLEKRSQRANTVKRRKVMTHTLVSLEKVTQCISPSSV
uniref:Uncharacterized protein n=1 Tax=Macaca fascicularis TaxID=9541 RepID=A0A7N9CTK4_MACFA